MTEEFRRTEREKTGLIHELRRVTSEFEAQVARGERLAGAVGARAREASELRAELMRAQSDELHEMTIAATARFQNQRLDEIVRRDREAAAYTLEQEERIAQTLQEELVHWHGRWQVMATESVEGMRAEARRVVMRNEQECQVALQDAIALAQEEEVQYHMARCSEEALRMEYAASHNELHQTLSRLEELRGRERPAVQEASAANERARGAERLFTQAELRIHHLASEVSIAAPDRREFAQQAMRYRIEESTEFMSRMASEREELVRRGERIEEQKAHDALALQRRALERDEEILRLRQELRV